MEFLHIVAIFIGVGFIYNRVVYLIRRLGYKVSVKEMKKWIGAHIHGGMHKCRLLLRHRESGHCVEFFKWAPRVGFGGKLEPSKYYLVLREGDCCNPSEFSEARQMLDARGIPFELETRNEAHATLKAPIGPKTDRAYELARDLYVDCFSLSGVTLRACFVGRIKMRTRDVIYGWTDALSLKKARHYERNRYGSYNDVHCAAELGHPYSLRLYMRKGRTRDVDERNDHGATPLITASYFGNPECAAILLENGASVRACDRSGRTALHCAAWKGHAAVAELLLGYDAPVSVKDKEGKTPLDLARENGHNDIVRLLSGENN